MTIADAAFYDSRFAVKGFEKYANHKSAWQRYRITNVLKIYTPTKDEIVLDVGCDSGTFSLALAPYCKEVTGIDFSPRAIEYCQKRAESDGVKNAKFVCADITKWHPEQRFDVVVMADLVEHIYNDEFDKMLDATKRLLNPGGKLVVWTPNAEHAIEVLKAQDIGTKHDPGHVNLQTMDRLVESLTRHSFMIRKAYYAASHLPGLRIIEKLFLHVAPFLGRRIAVLAVKL
jgi:2-polyprenyl-3-methyl-5-hydroxy-6-metoxy-1,4-benzoquinol methylase